MEKVVKIYDSFQAAEAANSSRLSRMSIEDRLKEFAIIQQRVWGKLWTETAIVKKITFEDIQWENR